MNLSFLIFGSGAVGSLIGARLAHAGYPVTFVVRPSVAKLIQSRGFTVRGHDMPVSLTQPTLATSALEALTNSKFDVIVLAVKSYDTPASIAEIAAVKDDVPTILCFQNGVDNEILLAETFGAEQVVAGTVTTAVSLARAGEVIVERARGIGLAAGHVISRMLADAMTKAGFVTRLYRDARAMKWSKLLTNLLTNATCAICDLPPRTILQDNDLYQLEIAALRETLAVMRRLAIPVVDLPRTPAQTLGFAARYLPSGLYRAFLTNKVDAGRGNKMPSFHMDLTSGRHQTEVSFINGAVARHGSALGIHTPVNRGLEDILTAISEERMEWEKYRHQPHKLAEALRR